MQATLNEFLSETIVNNFNSVDELRNILILACPNASFKMTNKPYIYEDGTHEIIVMITGGHHFAGLIFAVNFAACDPDNKSYRLLVSPRGYVEHGLPTEVSGKYLLQPVFDGTMVNMYYTCNSWKASSNNSYDILDQVLVGTKTFREQFLECIYNTSSSFDDLFSDYNKVYTVVFRHIELHPFRIHSEVQNDFTVIETQTRTDEGLFIEILIGTPVIDLAKTIATITETNKDVNTSHFGYILRGIDADNFGSNICESELYKFIRKTYYNVNTNVLRDICACHNNVVTGYNIRQSEIRLDFIALRACFFGHTREKFCKLFPQMNDRVKFFEAKLTDLVKHTYDCIRNKRKPTKYRKCVDLFATKLNGVNTRLGLSIVSDLVMNPANINIVATEMI
jgi:hypothetical protein